MGTTTIDLSWLCFVIPIGIIGIIAVLGTRSRMRYAQRIMDAQRRGAFNDMNDPKQRARFRWLALTALIGISGAMSSLAMLILLKLLMIQIPIGVVLVLFAVFGAMSVVAGFLMQREIDRRL